MSAWPDAALEPMPGRRIAAGELSLYTVVRGSGRPLVFLHGLGWTHALWRRQLERYGKRYRAIAADSRGASDKPTPRYAVAELAA
jgi:pimeloyl-ACP methyl ester carboxylesterase